MDSGEREMNTVTMTITNPLKKYWPSQGIEPATTCSQVLYASDWAFPLTKQWIMSQWISSILRKNTGQARVSNQWPPVLKSCALLTELWGLAYLSRINLNIQIISFFEDPGKKGFWKHYGFSVKKCLNGALSHPFIMFWYPIIFSHRDFSIVSQGT